jgi:hypothetical protein
VVDIGFVCSVCLSSEFKFFPHTQARAPALDRRDGCYLDIGWVKLIIVVFCKPIPACQMCK